MKRFPNIAPGEKRLLAFDFGGDVLPDATITLLDRTIASQNDPSPAARFVGSPVVEGRQALMWFDADAEADYIISLIAEVSTGERLPFKAQLVVSESAA